VCVCACVRACVRVCVCVFWLPYYISLLIMKLSPVIIVGRQTVYLCYYVSVFCAFLYTCTNPFIYATKFEPVRKVLLRMIPWKKSGEHTHTHTPV